MSNPTVDPVLRVVGLRTYFYTFAGIVKAVDGVSLQVNQGEMVGLVGESGSGKTVTAQSIMRIIPSPGKIVDGRIEFEGKDLLQMKESEMQKIRGKDIAYIPQDPTTTLDPVYSVGDQLAEVIMKHQKLSKRDALAKASRLLEAVEIPDPGVRINQYPHELSGGTKQRVAIARALSCEPASSASPDTLGSEGGIVRGPVFPRTRARCGLHAAQSDVARRNVSPHR